MSNKKYRLIIVILLSAFSITAAILLTRTHSQPNVIIVGNARFTVISPTCIRLEFDEKKRFTDTPTLFSNHDFPPQDRFEIRKNENQTEIYTDKVHLTYVNDSRPFNAQNLKIEFEHNGTRKEWKPGTPDTENLGGALSTVDRIKDKVPLPPGLISKQGWHLIDDSENLLLKNNWVTEEKNKELDWYFMGYGMDYVLAHRDLARISGPSPLLPRFAMGSWYSRYWPYSSAEIKNIVTEYETHQFPLDVMVLDMDWHREGWTGWSWNHKLHPDPAELLEWLHKKNIRVTLNLHPSDGVAPHEDTYSAFINKLGKPDQKGTTLPFIPSDRNYVSALFDTVLRPLLNSGIDFFWIDWQQNRFDPQIKTLEVLPWLNRVFYEHSNTADQRGLILSRWGGLGDHRNAIHFSGDSDTGWEMLDFMVPFTSTSVNSGCYYWSHDIGGHMGKRIPEAFARWVQFGALSAALRLHSSPDPGLDRRPWTYPPAILDSIRKSYALRTKLFPDLYSAMWENHQSARPFLRPMYYDFPQSPEAYRFEHQYMLGRHWLASPITQPAKKEGGSTPKATWLPPGEWAEYPSLKVIQGNRIYKKEYSLDEIPLFVRTNAPVVLASPERPHSYEILCVPGKTPGKNITYFFEDDGISQTSRNGDYNSWLISCETLNKKAEIIIAQHYSNKIQKSKVLFIKRGTQ